VDSAGTPLRRVLRIFSFNQVKRRERRLDLVDGHAAIANDYAVRAALDCELDARARFGQGKKNLGLITLRLLEFPVDARPFLKPVPPGEAAVDTACAKYKLYKISDGNAFLHTIL